MRNKITILSSILGVILFIILVIVLMNRTSELEQTQNEYNQINIEIESLDQEYESIKNNMLEDKSKIDQIGEKKKTLESERDCLEANLQNIIKGLEKKPCDTISQKKKTIVLKK